MQVLLWDIDGTLIRSGHAGSRSMNAAMHAVFGVASAFDGFDFAGRTDPWALDIMFRRHGLTPSTGEVARFYDVYVETLRRELHNPQSRTCAGVRELLAHFAAQPLITQALLTGNIAAGSRAKLEHFGLWHHFAFGAFADDSGDRNALGPVALRRAREHLRRESLAAVDMVVIGDTPHDVACARACGARVVAVATGRFSTADLAPHTPDLLLENLADPAPLLQFLAR